MSQEQNPGTSHPQASEQLPLDYEIQGYKREEIGVNGERTELPWISAEEPSTITRPELADESFDLDNKWGYKNAVDRITKKARENGGSIEVDEGSVTDALAANLYSGHRKMTKTMIESDNSARERRKTADAIETLVENSVGDSLSVAELEKEKQKSTELVRAREMEDTKNAVAYNNARSQQLDQAKRYYATNKDKFIDAALVDAKKAGVEINLSKTE